MAEAREQLESSNKNKVLQKDSKRRLVYVCDELYQVLEKIKQNVEYFTYGAEKGFSNYKASKVLYLKLKEYNLY